MKETDYSTIINLPHYISVKHPQMSMQNRAAQFAPFSALSGYEEAVERANAQFLSCFSEDDGIVKNNP